MSFLQIDCANHQIDLHVPLATSCFPCPETCFHIPVKVEGLETLDYLDNLQSKNPCTEQGDAVVFESE